MKTLKDLAINHPYYANESNFYSNEAKGLFACWRDFHAEYGNADVDMNLCYRFDVEQNGTYDEQCNFTPDGTYRMQVTIIKQRKGIYSPCQIAVVTEDDVPSIVEYLTRHWQRIQENWVPFAPAQAGKEGEG